MLMPDPNNALAIVLTISDGDLLKPLTSRRATAAMPFGGSYRIIDFALTNCLHSGVRRILVMTQYNALSLQNHIRDGWSIFNTDLGEFVMPVTPPIGTTLTTYTGAADALHKNLYLLSRSSEENVLLISGEQIYRMDYAALLAWHNQNGAEATIAGVPTSEANGGYFDVALTVSNETVQAVQPSSEAKREQAGLLWPMGVAVFRREKLVELLEKLTDCPPSALSVPALVGEHMDIFNRVAGYAFGGSEGRVSQDRYWRRLDSLDAYYGANMDLLELEPPLDLYQSNWPIRTYQTQRPPARTVPGRSCNEGICVNSIVGGGTVIAGGGVNHSVLGNRVYIDDGATVEDSILYSDAVVGEGARIRSCILDRQVHIPPGEEIGFDPAADRKRFEMTEGGVVVIPSDFEF